MAEITQKLGFDTSGGVTALNNLNNAINGVNESLKRLNSASVGRVNKSLNQLNKNLGLAGDTASGTGKKIQGFAAGVSPTIDAANQKINSLNQNLAESGQRADRAGRSISGAFVGFQLLGAAASGLRDIVSLLGDAAESSREFGLAIAEVSTIASPADTIRELSDQVRQLSRDFGTETVEQAEAAYQAYSNQIVQTTADIGFLSDANKLAVASASGVGDSVNVLSSIINSYGLAATDAAQISDVLFKGVEEGRFRLDEVANSFGTVTNLARESGVTFQEITAGLATITKTGTTASVAMTQLRGIVAKLLKPTELMKEAFASFGATDGPSAIKAAGGLSEVLQLMDKFAKANGTTLVEMFGRIRGGAGALALAADGGEEFNRILGELENSAGAATEAFEKINQTDARQYEIALQELKITLEELGDAVLPVITKFLQLGAKAIPDATTLGIVLAGLTATLGLAAVAAAALVTSFLPMAAIGAALLPFAPAFAAIAAATGLAILAAKEFNAAVEAGIEAQTAASKAALDTANERVRVQKEAIEQLKQAEKDVTQQIETEYGTQLDNARAFNQKLIAEFTASANQFVSIREAAVKELEKLSKTAAKISADANKRVVSNTQKLDDIKFDKSIKGFDNVRKGARQLQRATETARKARTELANAGLDQEKIRAALETRRRAEEQFAAAERTGALSKNATLERQIADAREKFTKDQIAQDKKLGKTADSVGESAAVKAAKAVAEQTTFIKGELETIKQLGNPFDASGMPKSLKDMAESAGKIQQAMDNVRKSAQADPTGGLADAAGLGEQLGPAGRELVDATVNFENQRQQIRNSLQNVIDSAPFQARVQFQEEGERAQAKLELSVDEQQIAALQAKLDRQLAQQNLNVPIGADTTAFEAGAQRVAGFFLGLVTDINATSGAAGAFTQAINNAVQGVQNLDQAGVAAANAQLTKVSETLKKAQDAGKISEGQAKTVQGQIDSASAILSTQEAILKKQEAATKAAAGGVPQKVNEGTTAVKNLGTAAKTTGDQVKGIGSAAQAGAGQLAGASSSAIGRLKAVESQALKTARAVQAALSGGGGGGTQTAFFGKRIHRQTGGFTRGQDRILTSTAPGEFVTNSAATRRFRAELTAINAGQAPQFREKGGAVTNVGDINVNIQTSDAADIEGRSIARELKRELRTRTSSL